MTHLLIAFQAPEDLEIDDGDQGAHESSFQGFHMSRSASNENLAESLPGIPEEEPLSAEDLLSLSQTHAGNQNDMCMHGCSLCAS